jgi:hypothetical protein
MLDAGWTIESARNALLLLMVLFENVHIGNCRSETVSAFRLSPLRSPVLLAGTLIAFAIHALALHLPALRGILGTEPVAPRTWAMLVTLALSVTVAMELHKWSWALRSRQSPRPPIPPRGGTASNPCASRKPIPTVIVDSEVEFQRPRQLSTWSRRPPSFRNERGYAM